MKQNTTAMHLKEVQIALDEAMRNGGCVSVRALKSNGEWVDYNGWKVLGSHWRRGNHRLQNPQEPDEIRCVPDVCIKYFNGRRMYL